MSDQSAKSASSEGKINPRIRNAQRVRPIPYESCGGLCSFLNSGCFTMCCVGPTTKKRSHQKKRGSKQPLPAKDEVSEIPKKLIKPNVDDGITESDRIIADEDDTVENKNQIENIRHDQAGSQNDVTNINEDKDSAFSRNEDNILALTDNVSISGSEFSGEKQKMSKKLMKFLKKGKKDPIQDEMSFSGSTSSLPPPVGLSETSTTNIDEQKPTDSGLGLSEPGISNSQELLIPSDDIPKQIDEGALSAETTEAPTVVTPEAEQKVEPPKTGKKIFAFFQSKKTKGKEDIGLSKSLDKINIPPVIDESQMIDVVKVIPLGASVPPSNNTNNQGNTDSQVERKRHFWKHSKKGKAKEEPENKAETCSLHSDNEDRPHKKTLLGVLGSLGRTPKHSNIKTQEEAIENQPSTTGAVAKSEGSNVPEAEENSGKQPQIRIVKNDFLPAEIQRNDKVNALPEAGFSDSQLDDEINSEKLARYVFEEIALDENMCLYKENTNEEEISEVFDPNEYRHSLYSMVGDEDPAKGKLFTVGDFEVASKDDSGVHEEIGESPKGPQSDEKKTDGPIPEGNFRTTCELMIPGSTEELADPIESKEKAKEPTTSQSFCDLIRHEGVNEATLLDNDLEKSTDTITEEKKGAVDWVDLSNEEEITDGAFQLIYEATVKGAKKQETSENPTGTQEDTAEKISSSEVPQASTVDPNQKDDVAISEAHSSPTLGSKSGSKSATPSPIAAKSRSGTLSSTNSEWQHAEEDIDRMMVMQGRSSLSSLGLRSDSMASVYSGAGEGRYGSVAVKGQVEFGLQYNYKAGALEIHVKQCKDLAPVDIKRNRSDPYVKVYLLPDKSKSGKRKTKVKKHTLNPVFDETLKFHISLNGLETRTLWLTVWHSDMFGRNDFLGEVMMALENKVFDDPTPKLYNLQERTEPFDDAISFKGDIIVCLKFVPPDMTVQKKGKRSRGTLHVLVKEAKHLTAYKANGTSDPFCKSYLLPDKGRNSKQKTPVIKKTVNPIWNHTFVYDDVTLQELAERSLELTVWDHDRLASNEFLGGVRFSLGTGKHYGKPVEWMDATGKEMTLWKSMLERPNFWVEGCLSLRPTLEVRIS